LSRVFPSEDANRCAEISSVEIRLQGITGKRARVRAGHFSLRDGTWVVTYALPYLIQERTWRRRVDSNHGSCAHASSEVIRGVSKSVQEIGLSAVCRERKQMP